MTKKTDLIDAIKDAAEDFTDVEGTYAGQRVAAVLWDQLVKACDDYADYRLAERMVTNASGRRMDLGDTKEALDNESLTSPMPPVLPMRRGYPHRGFIHNYGHAGIGMCGRVGPNTGPTPPELVKDVTCPECLDLGTLPEALQDSQRIEPGSPCHDLPIVWDLDDLDPSLWYECNADPKASQHFHQRNVWAEALVHERSASGFTLCGLSTGGMISRADGYTGPAPRTTSEPSEVTCPDCVSWRV